jgi:1-aminocyclopropane-1-carboxylate deaminase/D-cysteine desulfhydrase-like pyridoxal-dependent ACC family enzyme
MSPEELEQKLAKFPRLSYATYPTPLERCHNFMTVGNSPELWIKRDDGIGPALGGNKGRKLEYLIGEILAQGKSKVVTYGGLQSNHARMTAAACASHDLQAHLFFFHGRPSSLDGNLLVDHLCGAKLHFIPFGGNSSGAMTIETTNRLVRLVSIPLVGTDAYFMPVGGHSVTGCLGYVTAACELHKQILEKGLKPENVTLVTAAGTGSTLVGLIAGFILIESPIKVLGIDVGKLWRAFPASLARLASKICSTLDRPVDFEPENIPLIEGDYAGSHYGAITNQAMVAIRKFATSEGVLLDPVYTGKAFAGLMDLCAKGFFKPEDQVVFLHTGGAPGLWAKAYQSALSTA